MKYCIVQGFMHPRLCEDLSHKNIIFYDICDSELGLPLIKNLMSEVLNPKADKDIRYVMENFFKNRAINIDENNILHVNIRKDIKELLKEKELDVVIGEKSFKINTSKIKVTKYQMLKIEKSGILKENINDIFDDSTRQNIYVHITLE